MSETKPVCMRCGNSEFQVRYYYPSYWTARYQNGRWLPDHELHSQHRREVLFLACEVCGALNEETGCFVEKDDGGFKLRPLGREVAP